VLADAVLLLDTRLVVGGSEAVELGDARDELELELATVLDGGGVLVADSVAELGKVVTLEGEGLRARCESGSSSVKGDAARRTRAR